MLRTVFIKIFSTGKVLCSLFNDVVSFHNRRNGSFKYSGSGIRDLKVMKERWHSCQGSRLCMLSTASNWSKITFGAINLIFQIRAGWTDCRALPSLSRYSHLIIHISAYRETNKYFIYLRAAVCKYREFAVKTEISKYFIFSQKEPFGETFSKITFKVSKEFSFSRKPPKSEMLPHAI